MRAVLTPGAAIALLLLLLPALSGCLAGGDEAPPPVGPGPFEGPRPVLLVHGIAPQGGKAGIGPPPANAYGAWGLAMEAWSAWGLETVFVKVGYYAGDADKDVDAHEHPASLEDRGHSAHHGGAAAHDFDGGHGRDASIRHLAYHLAWTVHDLYTSQGVCVDVVAHSMGGLITRYAIGAASLAAEADYEGFPPGLCVRHVVTMGTPHEGAQLPRLCAPLFLQCLEMAPGSQFMLLLAKEPAMLRPAGIGGTRWLAIGSDSEEAARPPETTVAMGTDVAVIHEARDGVTHTSHTEETPNGPVCAWYLCRTDEEPTAHARIRVGDGPWTAADATEWPARRVFLFLSQPA